MKRLELSDELYDIVIGALGDWVESNDNAYNHMTYEEREEESAGRRSQIEAVAELVNDVKAGTKPDPRALTVSIWDDDDDDIELIADVVPHDTDPEDGMVYYIGKVQANCNDYEDNPMVGRTVYVHLPIHKLLGVKE